MVNSALNMLIRGWRGVDSLAERMKAAGRGNKQYAALPIRILTDGTAQVMLITSRETKRWVIPKGWPMKGKTAAEAALTEAFEEAGIEGEILGKKPLGTFHYLKVQATGERVLLRVNVFPMMVSAQLEDWPEKGHRETGWFAAAEAATMVAEPALAKFIRKIPSLVRRKGAAYGGA